ncbi:MAG: hypothetical protein J0I40_04930, partial [Cellulomonas sp.]|nr:hypothetical protein [Cellulomonas sp.]
MPAATRQRRARGVGRFLVGQRAAPVVGPGGDVLRHGRYGRPTVAGPKRLDDRQVLAHRLAGQEAAHRPYGGVVPEIAARAHVEALEPLIEAALADAGVSLDRVDAIAATAGPGLIGGVMVGLVTGKALAHAV